MENLKLLQVLINDKAAFVFALCVDFYPLSCPECSFANQCSAATHTNRNKSRSFRILTAQKQQQFLRGWKIKREKIDWECGENCIIHRFKRRVSSGSNNTAIYNEQMIARVSQKVLGSGVIRMVRVFVCVCDAVSQTHNRQITADAVCVWFLRTSVEPCEVRNWKT